MSEEKIIIEAQAKPVKAVASIELEAEIVDELKLADPDIAKAMKVLDEEVE